MIRKTVNLYGEEDQIDDAINDLQKDSNLDKVEVFESPLHAFFNDEAESVIRSFFSNKRKEDIDSLVEDYNDVFSNKLMENSDDIIDVEMEHDILRNLQK